MASSEDGRPALLHPAKLKTKMAVCNTSLLVPVRRGTNIAGVSEPAPHAQGRGKNSINVSILAAETRYVLYIRF